MKSLFLILSMIVVTGAYCAAPQTATEVRKEVTKDACKCDAKCTTSCACPQCPKKEATVKAKEAAATQAVMSKAEITTKAKA